MFMGLRFQKRIRLFKGLTINLSKTGASLSIGGRGATINLSKRGTKTTVGIPGTGISYSEIHKSTDTGPNLKANSLPEPAIVPDELEPPKSSTQSLFILAIILIWACYLVWKFL